MKKVLLTDQSFFEPVLALPKNASIHFQKFFFSLS